MNSTYYFIYNLSQNIRKKNVGQKLLSLNNDDKNYCPVYSYKDDNILIPFQIIKGTLTQDNNNITYRFNHNDYEKYMSNSYDIYIGIDSSDILITASFNIFASKSDQDYYIDLNIFSKYAFGEKCDIEPGIYRIYVYTNDDGKHLRPTNMTFVI